YLLDGYRSGITPNPDVMCNREIKFGAFLQQARAEGFDFVATGHYARRREDGPFVRLLEGVDKSKDQSYFLALLQQRQIRYALFPIGELLKTEVRSLASEAGLPNATRKDSQGICFIGQVRIGDFLRAFMEDSPGPIVDLEGRQLGLHRGLHFYTLGQRQGLRVASNTPHKAYVVVEKRPETNALVVALDEPSTPGLYAQSALLGSVSCTTVPLDTRRELLARPRYRASAIPATYEPRPDGTARITFHTPQRALTPGQICALYDGDEVLGGAVFTQVDPLR
ncbi:MAG: tRNA 2-thiouridine(34) synthase MnmA, partial [Verrucomicrobiia bacterium]